MAQRTDRETEAGGQAEAGADPEDVRGDDAQAGDGGRAAQDAGSGAGSPSESAAERIAALEEECEELRAKWTRAQADYQNLRRRGAMELDASLKRRLQPLLEDLLLVLDYLDMALSTPVSSEDAKGLATGIELTRTKLLEALEREDIVPIPSEGLFDPAEHEAAETEARPDVPAGSILRTLRPGYRWRGIVIRHARVAVAASPDAGAGEGGSDDGGADTTGSTGA